MSTFTQWNGPQGTYGPSAKDITALIDAYNQLSIKLTAHVESVAPTDSTVHGIVSYISNIKTQLEALIGAKAEISALNEIRTTAEAAATQAALTTAVQNLNELIAGKADTSLLEDKANVTTVATLSSKINSVENTLTELKDNYTEHTKHITDDSISLAFDCAIKSAEFIIGTIKALKYIDFTQWHTVDAQYAGTGSSADTGTNGLYVLGKLSDDWSDDANAPTSNKFKAARCFIKYENTHPLDAIIDMTATKTNEDWSGEIQVIVSKEANEWPNLQFHLCHGTYSDGKEAIYLCISADGLAKNNVDYSNLEFHIAGVNFIPLDIATAKRIQVVSDNVVSTGIVPAYCKNSIVANTYNATTISTDIIQDTQGTPLFDVHRFVDEYGQEHKYLMIGDSAFDSVLLFRRPVLVTNDDKGNEVRSPFVTTADLQGMATLPAGVICQWPIYEDVIEDGVCIMHRATRVPNGFHATDRSKLPCEDYPELAKLLVENETDKEFTLPLVDFGIIKLATETYNPEDIADDRTETFNYTQLTTTIKLLNERLKSEIARSTNKDTEHEEAINTEETRATTAEQTLQDNIDAEQSRATTAEQTLATYLIDKPVYPSADDLPNVTPDAQGNVINNGDTVIVFDGETITQYKATVTGTTVTWTEV